MPRLDRSERTRRRLERLRERRRPLGGTPIAPPSLAVQGRADAAKIERAVAFVNERASVIASALLEIGRYLLREFFGDDPATVSSQVPDKMNSLRDLAARPDLALSYSTLWRAVQLAVQASQVGTDSPVNQLGTSHAIELLAVDGVRAKEKLAKKALAEGWSKRRLGEEARRGLPTPRAGAGALGAVKKALRRVAEAAERGPIAPESIDDLPSPKLAKVVPLMRAALEALMRALPIAERTLAEPMPSKSAAPVEASRQASHAPRPPRRRPRA